MLLLFAFAGVGVAADPTPLTPSELAIEKAFLSKTPRVQTYDTPELIAAGGSLDYRSLEEDWFRGLSEDSFAKLSQKYPELLQKVQEGRAFRLASLDKFLALTDDYLIYHEGFDGNISARLRKSYVNLLQKYRVASQRKNRLQADLEAQQQTRVRFQYPDSLGQRDWDSEALRYFRKHRDWLEQEEQQNAQRMTLPTAIFQNWRKTEIARLAHLENKDHDYVWVTPPALDATPAMQRDYIYALGMQKGYRVRQTLRLLRKIATPSQQPLLLSELARNQLDEEKMKESLIHREFGERGAWAGGRQTKLHTPRDEWLLDLGWWGHSKGWDYWGKRQAKTWPWATKVRKVLDRDGAGSTPPSLRDRLAAHLPTFRGLVKGTALSAAVVAGTVFTVGLFSDMPNFLRGKNSVILAPAAQELEHQVKHWTGQREPSPLAPEPKPTPESAMRPGYRRTAENNSPAPTTVTKSEAPSRAVFHLQALGAVPVEKLPIEFQLPFVEDYAPPAGAPKAATEKGNAVFSLKNQVAYVPTAEGIVPLPSANGFRTRPQVEIDGGPAVAGRDYVVVKTKRDRYFLKFPGAEGDAHAPKKIKYVAEFFSEDQPTTPAKTQRLPLPSLPAKRLAEIAEKVQEAGFHEIAAGVRDLERDATAGRNIAIEALEDLVAHQGFYSRIPGVRHFGQAGENPFLDFREFLDKNTICGDCDVANAFTQSMARIAFADHPTIRIEKEALLVRDPSETELVDDNFHARLEITDSRFPDQRRKIDATPLRQDPRNPPQKIGPGQRPWRDPRPDQPSEKKPLAAAEPLVWWHRLRYPGQIDLQKEKGAPNEEPEKNEDEPAVAAIKPTDPALTLALQRLTQAERQAREKRNRLRSEQLRGLRTHLWFLGDAARLHNPLRKPGMSTPHQQIVAIAKLLKEYVNGELPPQAFSQALHGFVGDFAPPAPTPQTTLSAIAARLRHNINQQQRVSKDSKGTSRFAGAVAEGLTQPAFATLDYIVDRSWSPMEDVSAKALAETCRGKLESLSRR